MRAIANIIGVYNLFTKDFIAKRAFNHTFRAVISEVFITTYIA
jgi:hypothetical protein